MNKTHVLIVDDELVICDLLSEDLKELGYSYEVAQDGNSALQKMEKAHFDVILLDIRLPGISGIDILKEIKLKHSTAVIMVTAANDVNTAVISMKLGASDYIVKPFGIEIINSSIKSALSKTEGSVVVTESRAVGISDEERELQEIEAIASGIEVKFDLTDKRSEIVTKKTIEIARELGLSEERIQIWVEKRSTKGKKHQKTLRKFNQNAIAQTIMGVTQKYQPEENSLNSEN